MDKGERTKRKVMDAAVSLFNVKGYNGTSIRAIAAKAGVNVALISYYFGSKQGLLEELMTQFLEDYTEKLSKAYEQLDTLSAKECLSQAIYHLLIFQQQHHHLARFVHREVTLDTTLVREVMMTYFMKEKHYLKQIIETGIKRNEFYPCAIDMACIQIRALVTMPFSQPQYIREVFHLLVNEPFFIEKYMSYIKTTLVQSLYVEKSLLELNA